MQVRTGIKQLLHITYNQFQPIYHTVYTSPPASSKRYTTPSTHHLQPVPTDIPHRLHITYNQFQPIYHTVYTSPTNSSNRCTTPTAHHLHATVKLTTSPHQAPPRTDRTNVTPKILIITPFNLYSY